MHQIPRCPTGIPGFDVICKGGLPSNRTTLITGTAGSGKTVLALQTIVCGVRDRDENGIIVTFEESTDDLIRNAKAMGWALDELVDDGRVRFVDASSDPTVETLESGRFDFTALTARIEAAVRAIDAKRVVVDSIGSAFSRFSSPSLVRTELHRLAHALRRMGVTSLLSSEREDDHGAIARFGVEEFVADNVVILRNALDEEHRRRTIEVLKLRGCDHFKGEFPFTIDGEDGVHIEPLSSMELTQRSGNIRVKSGNDELDVICGGGIFRDSVSLVSGATGTGKTLLTTEFIRQVEDEGEKAILLAFEESVPQLVRNAASWGVNYEAMIERGQLTIAPSYPESRSLEDHLLYIKRLVDEVKPARFALDSLTALARAASDKSFREFVIGLTGFLKEREVTSLFTNTAAALVGGESATEHHISTITDMIILLRYVEMDGAMRRGLTVLKMRGSWHEKMIREFSIDDTGMHILEPFVGLSGILSGRIGMSFDAEQERLTRLFEDVDGSAARGAGEVDPPIGGA